MKRFVSLVLALMLCAGFAVPALAAEFSDVPASHTFHDAILDCSEKGIVGGYSDGTFKPTDSVTRAQFCVMLSRAFYAGDIQKYDTDEYQRIWFGPNTKALSMAGVLEGTGFSYAFGEAGVMNQNISRYDMAQLMSNIMADKGFFAGESDKDTAAAKIADYSEIPDQYRDAVTAVYALGIIGGFSDGTFGGGATMNRGQAAVVIYRLAQFVGDGPGTEPETSANDNQTNMQENPAGPVASTPLPVDPDTSKPETPGLSDSTLSNGKAITEENVLAMLNELMAKYPSGTLYAPIGTKIPTQIYYQAPSHASYGTQCAGWAAMANDYIFGKTAPVKIHTNFNQVRVGDVFYSTEHKMVITGTKKCVVCGNMGYTVTQSGSSYLTSWDGMGICPTCGDITYYTNSEIITRYPADSTVPYLSLNGTAKPGPSDKTSSSGSNTGSSNTGASSGSGTTTQPSTGTDNNSYAAWSANKTCDLCGGVTPTWTLSADRSRHICENCAKTTAGKNYIAG